MYDTYYGDYGIGSFMSYDEEDKQFIRNIDKIISYLIKNTTDMHNASNYDSLLSELFNHFHQMQEVLMSHYNTWRFKYDRIYFTMTTELPHKILIAAINNEDRITHTEKENLERIIDQYNITLDGYQVDDQKVIVLDNVPFSCYYPILKLFKIDKVKKQPTQPKQPRRKSIKYYPSPFHNNIFRMIYNTYIKYLKAVGHKIFNIKNISTVQPSTMMSISNSLRYEYEYHIIQAHKPRKVVKFFKRVKIFNQLVEHRFHGNTTNYNKIHFWIRRQYLDIRIYKILKYHDDDTLQWFLKYTDTFKYLTEWRIERYEENIRKQKRIKEAELRLQLQIKPEPIQIKNKPVYYHSQWDNSYPVIRSGDENIDRQLRSIVSTFIEDDI